jgi:hypothetical protein
MSRVLTTEYDARPCLVAFNRTLKDIDVDSINQYGAFGIGIDVPRLAFIDGQADPWLFAGAHAPTAPKRADSILAGPFVELDGAVHHWDENGLFRNDTHTLVPETIEQIKDYEEAFVRTWIDGKIKSCSISNANFDAEYNIRCRRYREC